MKKVTHLIAAALALASALPVAAGQPAPVPQNVTVAGDLSSSQVDDLLAPALRYYGFWNSGDPELARSALAADFVDLNLPQGRKLGPEGPLDASAAFRKAVPDLKVDVRNVYVLRDTVIGQLQFSGHFTGTFGELKGDGRAIRFDAVDIYTIRDGKIRTNWHLEDNLTLLREMGALPPG